MEINYKLIVNKDDFINADQININIELKDFSKDYNWSGLEPLSLESEKLEQVDWLKYYNERYQKEQIVIHHTVSGPGISGDLATWKNFDSHIATCVIIERDGSIKQLFNSAYWGYHLKCGNENLDKHSIAIELDNWGQLTEKNGYYYNVYNERVDVPIVYYPAGFREENIFEAYTREQLWSLGQLLLLWNKNYNIPLDYNSDMWDISQRALEGTPGIWAHVSFRSSGKWDAHPDPQLISLLKSLKKDQNL